MDLFYGNSSNNEYLGKLSNYNYYTDKVNAELDPGVYNNPNPFESICAFDFKLAPV